MFLRRTQWQFCPLIFSWFETCWFLWISSEFTGFRGVYHSFRPTPCSTLWHHGPFYQHVNTDKYLFPISYMKYNYSSMPNFNGSLTHWGRATHICVGKVTTISSDNGLSPERRQAIIWTIAGMLLIGPLGTNFSEILIWIQTFSLKKMHLKMSSAKWRPFVSASMC